MKEDMLYIRKVIGTEFDEENNQIVYKLSKEYIAIDKGRAIYYAGFTNHYILIGFMRSVFSEPARTEIMNTAYQLGDAFIYGNQKWSAVWTGDWEPLERIGMVSVTLQTSMFEKMINEIYASMKENGGKLKDR